MNRNVLIATTIAAAAGAVLYYIKRKKRSLGGMQFIPVKRTRHLVDAFSKAKKHPVES